MLKSFCQALQGGQSFETGSSSLTFLQFLIVHRILVFEKKQESGVSEVLLLALLLQQHSGGHGLLVNGVPLLPQAVVSDILKLLAMNTENRKSVNGTP